MLEKVLRVSLRGVVTCPNTPLKFEFDTNFYLIFLKLFLTFQFYFNFLKKFKFYNFLKNFKFLIYKKYFSFFNFFEHLILLKIFNYAPRKDNHLFPNSTMPFDTVFIILFKTNHPKPYFDSVSHQTFHSLIIQLNKHIHENLIRVNL